MLILFDHGAPRGLRRSLRHHTVYTARQEGWDTLNTGLLLGAAEEAGFDLLLTTDRGIRYQQNLQGRGIAILALTGTTNGRRCGCMLNGSQPQSTGSLRADMPNFRYLSTELRSSVAGDLGLVGEWLGLWGGR